VAKIVRDHGGVVECVSRERGTTFRVLLPMMKGGSDGIIPDSSEAP
jgi:nitrogen-specific signal transduction histidine kinase